MNTAFTLAWIGRLHKAEYQRQWRNRPENRDRVRETERVRLDAYRRANQDKCNTRSCASKRKMRTKAKGDPALSALIKERARNSDLKMKYGITAAEYDAIEASQGGVCAICSKSCKTGRKLAVDHDHETGVIRGLLCANCNRGIGHLQESTQILKNAIAYIEKHSGGNT